MRFSLATLLLLTLWLSTGGLVIVFYHPWQCVQTQPTSFPSESTDILESGRMTSPDGRRSVLYEGSTLLFVDGKMTLYEFDYWEGMPQLPYRFPENDTLELLRFKGDPPVESFIATYKRRFPEYWWGHAFRPEVWSFLALSALLIQRFLKHRRAKTSPSASEV